MESGDNNMIMEFEIKTDNVTTSTPDPSPCTKNNTGQQGLEQQQQPQQTQGSGQAVQDELHTQGNDKFIYTCNSCNKSVETRYVQYSIMIIVLFSINFLIQIVFNSKKKNASFFCFCFQISLHSM